MEMIDSEMPLPGIYLDYLLLNAQAIGFWQTVLPRIAAKYDWQVWELAEVRHNKIRGYEWTRLWLIRKGLAVPCGLSVRKIDWLNIMARAQAPFLDS